MAKTIPYCGVPVDVVSVIFPKPKRESLYDRDSRYTEEAQALHDRAHGVLRPIFKDFFNAGYSPREIAHIMQEVARDLESEAIL